MARSKTDKDDGEMDKGQKLLNGYRATRWSDHDKQSCLCFRDMLHVPKKIVKSYAKVAM